MNPELKEFYGATKIVDNGVDYNGRMTQREKVIHELAQWMYWSCYISGGSVASHIARVHVVKLRDGDWAALFDRIKSGVQNNDERSKGFLNWIHDLDTLRAFQ